MLVRFCVVALVLFSVFSIFCITLFGPRHQETTSWLALDPMGLDTLWSLHNELPYRLYSVQAIRNTSSCKLRKVSKGFQANGI